MKSFIATRPACRLRKRHSLEPFSLRQEEGRGVGAKLSEAKPRSPGTSTSGRNYAQAACLTSLSNPRRQPQTRGRPRLGVKEGRRGPPLPPPPTTRGALPRATCWQGASRDAAGRAVPAGGPPVAPAGRVPPRSARAPPRSSLAGAREGGAPERKGKGREKGREEESRGRNPSHVTQGQPGKLRGGAWRRHFPAAACPSCPVGLQLTREGVG